MSAATLVKTPWQFGDRSMKEDIKNGVVLPKLNVEHPMSRLVDPDQLSLCGTSRIESRISEKHGSLRHNKSRELPRSRVSNLPYIPDGEDAKTTEDRSKVHIPVFGNNAGLSNRIESRLTAISYRSVENKESYNDKLSTTQLEKKIRDKMKTGYFSMKNLFQSYDPEERGKVNREQLIRILSTFLAMKISLSQFNRLMSRLGFQQNKFVTFEEFYHLFKNKKEADNEYPTWFFQEKGSEDNCTASKVHTYLKLEATKNLGDLLISLNILTDENIIKPEFHNSLKGIGYDLKPIEFEKLWKKYDDSNTGVLEVRKLIERLTGTKKSRQSDADEQCLREQSINIEKWLTKKFREGFHEMQHAFKEVEVDGMVSRDQFITVLQDYGLFLKDNRLDMFLERCHVPSGAKVDYKLFLSMFQNRGENGLTNKILHNQNHRYHHPNENDNLSVVTDTSAIEALLVDMFQTDFLKLLNTFQKIDHKSKGTISTIEFRAALESFLGVKILDTHFSQLMKNAPTDNNGRVNYQEFLAQFDSKSSKTIFDYASSIGELEDGYFGYLPSRCSSISRQSVATPATVSAERSVAQLSVVIKDALREHFESVEKTFHELDEKNTKRMNKDIMQSILSRIGLHISSSETDALWKHIITDQRGTLEFTQFIRHFGFSMKSAAFPNSKRNPPIRGDQDFRILSHRFNSSKELIEDFVKNLIEKKYSEMWKTFEGIDKPCSGYIDDEQFKNVLHNICPDLTVDELVTLTEKYSDSGRVPWKKFMGKYCPHRVGRKSANISDLIKHSSMEEGVSQVNGGAEEGLPLMYPRLREKITCGKWKELRREFKEHDRTNKGFLTVDEFKNVLKACDINLDSNDLYRVLSVIDEQLEGKIQYVNLCKLVPSNYSL